MSSRRLALLLGSIAVVIVILGLAIFHATRPNPQAVSVPASTPTAAETSNEASPSPAAGLELPVANTAWLDDDVAKLTMFDRLKISIPSSWNGTMSDPDKAWNFADSSTCGDVPTAECPSIHFLHLADSEATAALDGWASAKCSFGQAEAMEGPVDFTIDGQSARFYRVNCGTGESSRYAWHVPSRNILVTTYEGSAGSLSIENVQGVLSTAAWV